jgi:hypothetical protein
MSASGDFGGSRDVCFTPESRHSVAYLGLPLSAINVRFASRRTAAKFASLFDEAGGGVRDIVSQIMVAAERAGSNLQCVPLRRSRTGLTRGTR